MVEQCTSTIEIGQGNFYVPSAKFTIERTREGKGDKAKVQIELPRDEALRPAQGPWLCSIVNAKGQRRFGGILFDKNIKDSLSEENKILDLDISGFFALMQLEKIERYQQTALVSQHVFNLALEAGVINPTFPNAFSIEVVEGPDAPRRGQPVEFIIDKDLYLNESLDLLAAQTGYTWEIVDVLNFWTNIADIGPPLGVSSLAKLIFRKNSVQAAQAPKPIFRKPRENEPIFLDDVFWEGEDQLAVVRPRITKVKVLGRNGELATDENFPASIQDEDLKDIPKKPVALRYSYPETASRLLFGMLSSKLPDSMNPNPTTPCADIVGVNITFAGRFLPTASGNSTLALFADRDNNDGTGTVAGTASYFYDLTNVNLMGKIITAPFRVGLFADIRVFGSAFASPATFMITLNRSGQQIFTETRTLTPDLVSGIARLEFVYNADLTPGIGGMLLISAVASIVIAPSNEPVTPPAGPGENIESSGQLNLSFNREAITCTSAPPPISN